MSKTVNKQKQGQGLKRYEDGYQTKQNNVASRQRKQLKHIENALRAKDLHKLMIYEDQL